MARHTLYVAPAEASRAERREFKKKIRQIEREVMVKLRHGERADRLRSYAS